MLSPKHAGGIWGKSHCDPKRSIWDVGFWEKTIDGVSQEGRLAQKPTLCVCFFGRSKLHQMPSNGRLLNLQPGAYEVAGARSG